MNEPTANGVGVILLSYNRPKMLDIAFDSIKGADEVILVDDGSTEFDPSTWADAHEIAYRVVGARRPVEHRMTQAVLGSLINQALHLARNVARLEAVTYLCDDDIFSPTWIQQIRGAICGDGAPHVCRGQWRSFDDPLADGCPIVTPRRSRPTPLDIRKMTTGNFAHRLDCYEEGLRWSEVTVAVHDDTFLWNLLKLHPPKSVLDTGALAGYRREHRFNGANYTAHHEYAVGAFEWLSRGALE